MAVLWAKACFEKTAFENNPHSGRETRSPSHVVNISPPPNHGIQSQAMKRSTFSSGPQNYRASGDLLRPQLNTRLQIQSMFFAFAEFNYS